jgi:hypothetical protein
MPSAIWSFQEFDAYGNWEFDAFGNLILSGI